MRTILHIGMPKTRSTVLQDCLRGPRGALYPQNPPGRPFSNHPMPLFGFLPRRDPPRRVRKYPRRAWDARGRIRGLPGASRPSGRGGAPRGGGALLPLRGLWRPWRLEEVVAIDPAMRRALLERRARSRRATADPAWAARADGLLRAPRAA